MDNRIDDVQVDIGIISIRGDEFEAVVRKFRLSQIVRTNRQFYQFASVDTEFGPPVGVVAVRCPNDGPGASQRVATDLIADFDPSWILLVGIAGAFPSDEYCLGDVALAIRFADMSVSAALDGSQREFAAAGGPMHPEVENFLAHLPAFHAKLKGWNTQRSIGMRLPEVHYNEDDLYGYEDWRRKVVAALDARFPDGRRPRPPRCFAAPTVDGAVLLKDSNLARQWLNYARQTATVEMEIGGVYQAARGQGGWAHRVLAIRGISDVVGYRRGPQWTAYACRASAALAHVLVKNNIIDAAGDRPSRIAQVARGRTPLAAGRARAGISYIPMYHDLFGRDGDIARVKDALAASPVVCIMGMPGIGKSHLAAEIAHNMLTANRMDHVIWVQDQDGNIRLTNLLDRLAICFDLEHATRLPLETKRQVILRVMAQSRCLIIIDNFETIEDGDIARFASECPGRSRILATSRERTIPNAVEIPIKKLVKEYSIRLLRYHLLQMDASLELDETALGELALAADGNPLALKWAVGQLVHSGLSLESTREYLESARGDLFPKMFDRSWDGLTGESKMVLQAIAAMAAPVTVAYMSGASDFDITVVDEALTGLSRSCLVDADTQMFRAERLYSVHPLTRSFVRVKCEREPEAARSLWDRLAAYWLEFAAANGGMDWNWEGYDRLAQHSVNLLDVVERRAAEKRWEEVKGFHRYLSNPLSIRGLWYERLRIAERAIEAARATGDLRTEAWCLVYDVAYTHLKRKQLDRAREATITAQDIFRALANDGVPDLFGEAACAHHLGKVSELGGDLEAARAYYRESHDLYAGDADYVYFLETELAALLFGEGNYNAAEEIFRRAYFYAQDRGGKCKIIVARCHVYLGAIAESGADLAAAENHYRQGRETALGIGRADLMAETSYRLSRLFADTGRLEEARGWAEDARRLYMQLGDEGGMDNTQLILRRTGSD